MVDTNQNTSIHAGEPGSSDSLLNKNMDELVDELLKEKKILEEKNKKLASMLNICAKNANAGREPASSGSANASEISEQLASFKKYVSDVQKKLEKSISSQSSDQWKTVMAEMKTRFSAIEEKMAAVDNIKTMQKKLDELEAEIRDRHRRGGNPFGQLGSVLAGAGAAQAPEGSDDDIIGKLDEFEQRIDKLGSRISNIQKNDGGAESGGFLHKLGMILAPKAGAQTQPAAKPGEPSVLGGITLKPVTDKPPKVSEEALEKLIFENPAEAAGKLKIKFHEPADMGDASKIQEDIRAGDVILVNIGPLRQNDMELLRKLVANLKKTCYAVNGNIVGMGDNYLIVMPRNVQVHKEENSGFVPRQ